MKVLLDANVLIAAVASQGVCHLVVELCLAEHELVMSHALLDEVGTKLLKRLKVPAPDVHGVLAYFRQGGTLVTPHKVDKRECRDPKDLHVLGAALAGQADVIVTGDADLLVLTSFQGIPIKSPRSFWEMVRKK
ncbi:MAG: putative toxin-antitoxin system toxin component, PIN family [Elusimicrobia bacterium]|nr:putative toxin-antitoxin system toxin component, PIN family [Elusimicrobiota bacterium]MBP9128160.1 putative toxin-antitoxin system toxin component, PIN family [Elusimicrobiota bacterium]MBP9698945.1 putative toxin-antitoxin system toxin component, PIN family [Elusimicrobiota bacterium]